MTCALLDLQCHAKSAVAGWWLGLDWYVQAMIVIGLLLIVGGSLWGAAQALKRIGGWPAVVGAVLLILAGLFAVFKPKKKTPSIAIEDEYPPMRKKPRVRTIFDGWKQR